MRPAKTASNLRAHAKKRAFQRLGLRLNRHDLAWMVNQIKHGHSTPLLRSSLNRTKHMLVMPDGQRLIAVYDKKRSSIVTVWPKS